MKINKKIVVGIVIASLILIGLISVGVYGADKYLEQRDEACMKKAILYTAQFQTEGKVFLYLNETNNINSISVIELCSDK